VNDGKRKCGDAIIQADKSQPPFDIKSKTQVVVCSDTFDITNIDKSYMIIDLDVPVQMVGLTAITDPDSLLKVFIGFKDSNQALRETGIRSRSDTGYKSNTLQYEGFAYANYMCDNQKRRKRGIHTTYSNVFQYMPAVCGTYINLKDLVGGNIVHARFQICIPFTDMLVFSFFSYLGKFPSFMADLTLQDCLLGHGALVWTLCSPNDVRENKVFLQGDVMTGTYADLSLIDFEHRFGQVNTYLRVPSNTTGTGASDSPLSYTSSRCQLMVTTMRVEDWRSHIKGYMIADQAKQSIYQSIQKLGGLVFPSQQCFYYEFNSSPTPTGLKASATVALSNANSLLIGYRVNSEDSTCVRNPGEKNVYCKADNVFIPNEAYETTSISHLCDLLAYASLNGPLNPSEDLENSVINGHNKPDGEVYKNCMSDDTSYLPIIPLERGDGAFVIDGINTHGKNIPIEIVGAPQFSGVQDTYYHPNPEDLSQINTIKPFMLECRDTFWVVDTKGAHYFSDSTPRGSQLLEPDE
jgi:hypothetical protein